MKEKILKLADKIKPWIKTKRAWIQIGLSLIAIICVILACVSSCSVRNVNGPTPKPTATATVKATKEATEEPVVTDSPKPTEVIPTATPVVKATENAVSGETDTQVNNSNETNSTTASNDYAAPTGAPLYTPVPEESVSTKTKAYRTVVESCKGLVDSSFYYLYDMDSDGVEELILHAKFDELTSNIEVYTFSEDGLIFVGDAAGSYASVSGCSRGGILVYYRRNNSESIENFIKEGYDMYSNTMAFNNNVAEYTVLEEDVPLEAHRIDDLSFIK